MNKLCYPRIWITNRPNLSAIQAVTFSRWPLYRSFRDYFLDIYISTQAVQFWFIFLSHLNWVVWCYTKMGNYIFVSFLAETFAIVECQKCLKLNSSMVNIIFFPGGSGDLKSAHWNPETYEIQTFWRLDFKWSGFSYGYSYSPNHSKSGYFCPDFKWFLATWRPFVRI